MFYCKHRPPSYAQAATQISCHHALLVTHIRIPSSQMHSRTLFPGANAKGLPSS